MLMPKKTKYRKYQRGRNRGVRQTGHTLSFGEFGLKTLENEFITQTNKFL